MGSRSGGRAATRAVVTGGAGFIGSHLVGRLVAEGIDVLVIDDLSAGDAGALPRAARLETLDIVRADLEGVLRASRPSVVYHLAAQVSVPQSARDPLGDLAVNVVGTARLLAACRDAGVGRLVFASSGGAIYGERARAASEATRPAPASHYGWHKLVAEAHVRLGGSSYAIVRPSNVYGPRQRTGVDGAVVAAFVERASRSGALEIHGDGGQSRDLVHVRDVVDALVLLGRAGPSGTWNVASGRRVTVNELAGIVERLLGRTLERLPGPRRADDIRHSAISAARLRALGWRPRVGLAAGVRELLDEATGGAARPRS